MKLAPLLQELLLRLFMIGIRDTAVIDGAHLGAARRGGDTHALSALIRVDDILSLALANSLVLALSLTGATADAILGNLIGHLWYLLKVDIWAKLSLYLAHHLLLPLQG